jgi:endonuclease YncB( thermonuclease family)
MDRGTKWVVGVVSTAIVIGMMASQIGDGQAAEPGPERVASAMTVAPTATTVAPTTTEAPTTTVAPTTTEAPTTTVAPTTTTTVPRTEVIRWVDGDTVQTTLGTVRLIGMDTPERGAPCSARATANADRLAPPGSTVKLIPVQGRDDTDRYDRLLRYVVRGRVDVGYRQIVNGLADARYDSGEYGTHPQRDSYRQADAEHPNQTCEVTTTTTSTTSTTTSTTLAPTTTTVPPTTTTEAPVGNCDSSYPDFCIPAPSPDLDCGDVNGTNFSVVGSDPHGFDSDGDGVGCES